jgi:hypothetical protein
MSPPKLRFERDIRPLFRAKDVSSMIAFKQFDLSKYADVVSHNEEILRRLKKGDMPCDGKWPPNQIKLFEGWVSDGMLP